MEDKGLRVNMDKTKILVCRAKPVPEWEAMWQVPVWCMWERGWPKLNSLHSVWEVDYIKDVVE